MRSKEDLITNNAFNYVLEVVHTAMQKDREKSARLPLQVQREFEYIARELLPAVAKVAGVSEPQWYTAKELGEMHYPGDTY